MAVDLHDRLLAHDRHDDRRGAGRTDWIVEGGPRMTESLSQSIPSGTWLAVAGVRGLWVYQRTGRTQSLILGEDGAITSPAGPVWDIRINPAPGNTPS